MTIRKLFDGKPLVPGVKALLAHIHGDPQWSRVAPPLSAFPAPDRGRCDTGLRRGPRQTRSHRLRRGRAPGVSAR